MAMSFCTAHWLSAKSDPRSCARPGTTNARQGRHHQREQPPLSAPAQTPAPQTPSRQVKQLAQPEPEYVQRDAQVSGLIDRHVNLCDSQGRGTGRCRRREGRSEGAVAGCAKKKDALSRAPRLRTRIPPFLFGARRRPAARETPPRVSSSPSRPRTFTGSMSGNPLLATYVPTAATTPSPTSAMTKCRRALSFAFRLFCVDGFCRFASPTFTDVACP